MKKHCPGCCPGCNNGYAQADCANHSSGHGGCGYHHGCGCNHHHGCSSCGGNGFGTLRSVSGPFSNCGNRQNNDSCFPYYTGPCGPCEPCRHCCCREWPWPWPPMPPFMPVNESGYDYSEAYSARDDGEDIPEYTSHKNCYRTEASAREAFAARQVKPIVDCGRCRHSCDN